MARLDWIPARNCATLPARSRLHLVVSMILLVAVAGVGWGARSGGVVRDIGAPLSASAAVDMTGRWQCCGKGGQPAQTWILEGTADNFKGRAVFKGTTVLIGAISGQGDGSTVAAYLIDFATGSAIVFNGTLARSGNSMAGTWVDANRGTKGTWRATREDDGKRSILGKVTSVRCEDGSCHAAALAGATVTAKAGAKRFSAASGADGAFEIAGVVDGRYTVAAAKGARTFVPDSQIVVVNGGDERGVDFATCDDAGGATQLHGPQPCLLLDASVSAPHKSSISAGEKATYTARVSTPAKSGTVIVVATLPSDSIASIVPGSITGGGTASAGDITWRLNAATLKPVSFALRVKTRGLPLDQDRMGVAFTATWGKQHTDPVAADLDLMPCGQDPPEFGGYRSVSGAGWTMQAGIDPEFGLVVNNLRVGHAGPQTRLVARRISVPYLLLQTSVLTKPMKLQLEPNGNAATGRSRLLSVDLKSGDWKAKEFAFQATYGIDHLGKNSGSCLLVTLTYGFKGYGVQPTCNPLSKPGILQCSQFRPMLTYEFRASGKEKLRKIETAQRIVVDIGGQAKTSALIRDNDLPPAPIAEEQQLAREVLVSAIRGGEPGDWDNFHESIDPDFVDAPGDLVRGTVFACLDCFHMHWRWGDFLGLALPYGGRPIIPKDSTQTARVAVVKPRNYEERELVQSLLGNDVVRGGPVAFYWLSSNNQANDSFFYHWSWVIPPDQLGVSIGSEASGRSALARFLCPAHWSVAE